MKNNLSALEELRIQKAQLAEECNKEKQRLLHNVEYAKSNFGRLMLNSAFTSTKNGVSDVVSLFSGKSKSGPKKTGSSGLVQTLMAVSPFVWDILQPILIGAIVKKIKSAFSGKKKKN